MKSANSSARAEWLRSIRLNQNGIRSRDATDEQMTTRQQSWQRVTKLFDEALERAPEERSEFLKSACAGDRDLLREVESLLAEHESEVSFLESPAVEAVADQKAGDAEHLLVGEQFGSYRIQSLLGRGGMGEIYLAQDKLGRKIALKLLTQRLPGDESGIPRFQREARTLLALNHPHIVTIYDIGQVGDVYYIASELVEGETLRRRLDKDDMLLQDLLEITIQVATALAAAHEKGIVHRDIKPENIMIGRDGLVKVLDFGIAKLTKKYATAESEAPTLKQVHTAEGMVIGTAPYMSPEQARGLKVDARTDIWSLGVVIYEVVAGRKPFSGDTVADVINSVIEKAPAPLLRYASDVPEALEWIVSRALRKQKDARYQTANELLFDLKELKEKIEFAKLTDEVTSPAAMPARAPASDAQTDVLPATSTYPSSAEFIVTEIKRHRLAFTVCLLVLVAGIVGVGIYLKAGKTEIAIESLAVLPFRNESGNTDAEYLSDGITESLINSLSQLPKLSVKARSSVFRYKGKEVEPQQIASELSVQAILTGRVVQRGDELALYLSLVDARSGNQLWGEQYNRRLTDLLALQREIARDVSSKLRGKLSGADEQRVMKDYTANTEAFRLYLNGRYHYFKLTEAEIRKSIGLFQQALDADPAYARAYAGMADSYRTLPIASYVPSKEAFPQAKAAARRALDIDDDLADAHIVLGWVGFWFDWDWTGAENQFRRAIELSPDNADAYRGYAQLLSSLGRHDEAIATIEKARALDALTLVIQALEAQYLFYAGRDGEAIARAQKVLQGDSTFWLAHNILGRIYTRQERYDEAIAAFVRARELSSDSPEVITQLGYALAKSGKHEQAQATLKELRLIAAEKYVPAYSFAMIHNGLGEREDALKHLEKSFQEREAQLTFIKIDTRWDGLRAEPRFQAILRGVGF